MAWSLSFLIITLTITILGFLWGIIKVFKKPHEDKSWEIPLDELKKTIKHEDKECRSIFNNDIIKIKDTLVLYGNEIHDLKKDKEVLTKNMDELKNVINNVSMKCDKILDKVIEYMNKDNN